MKNGQWKEADDETYRLMITEVGKDEGQRFDREDLLNFPCEPLKAIDGLWVKYSKGRFGFSVQKDLYLKCGGDGEYHEKAWEKFCETNGWKNEWWGTYDVTYDTSSPEGHLPQVPLWGVEGVGVGGFSSLASRLVNCNL